MLRLHEHGGPGPRNLSASRLLAWYEPRRVAYPWRADPHPYGVLVSEMMLQQTQVSRVVPAYLRFLSLFPTPAALAAAPLADVLRAWKGLGYNRRAAALWRAAGVIVAEHAGAVPSDPAALAALPGVGPYTAAAVASFAFGAAVPAIDTNVHRVVARHRLGLDPPGGVAVRRAAEAWIDRADPGAWNAALMDLGREVCRPEPLCAGCPLRRGCRFRAMPGGVRRPGRRPEPFAGSMRQLRGRIVDAVREAPSVTVAEVAARWSEPHARVAEAVAALAGEGLVRADSGGRISLGDGN
ncbi:MAG TPA: A/G-specific adenine glycosylase [Actinomycetota bacterium]|nr:A/G-specific adenine glycosylase [Actinomycetota bacterium]